MTNEYQPWGMEPRVFLLLMHLSQLAGVIIPFAGLVLPIVMWVTNKQESKEIDEHGKVIMNWIISAFIYTIICTILMVLVIGVFGLIILAIVSLIFIIVGAIKAYDGELWPYPLSITFIK
ncbi:DUF4870 domain-containing protein [Glaciecola petra]|uniref:DUF4870 domain-containing protein n=1 Tax=Glaciecola petra TaxID=3075602 RepID=A0ABU2ZLN7_9ALTE|nr:DUF4870 domain-containing protein [Aestuariibacter sp. P117]MDT0593316.1 DUF4870 domain-containing protein [Aestuariibacter sp. P117]